MFAGIDTHKDTLAVAVIDSHGRPVADREVPNTERGFAQLVALLEHHRVERVGIEGSGSFGRAVAVHLTLAWQANHSPANSQEVRPDLGVVEVPTLMTSRERRAQLKGKTDPVDALAVARVTAREPHLPPVRLTVGPAADLRALLDYREDLLLERTALANRAHADLTGLVPGYQHQIPNLTSRARVRQVLDLLTTLDTPHDGSPGTGTHLVRADLTRRRLERVIAIDAEAAALKRQIAGLVEDAGSTLTDIHGIGPIVAARLLAEVVDARRYPTRDAFAAANGTAPIPASSGRTVRHRYNPGGNRQLNKALYTIAITQIGADTEGRAYYHRKRAAGKTSREALRSLKRRLSDLVYRTMLTDATAAATDTNSPPVSPVVSQAAVDAADAQEARLTA
ncbi:IS110 family transposase [Nocardioides gansuensis]|uniref:IS110 family transposase n=1 Tax=Nocardioides gansuensis TaxID=2138300 RepID=UPI001BAE379C|nr:IS110 family transposase [Nocardioides gansuensis]